MPKGIAEASQETEKQTKRQPADMVRPESKELGSARRLVEPWEPGPRGFVVLLYGKSCVF